MNNRLFFSDDEERKTTEQSLSDKHYLIIFTSICSGMPCGNTIFKMIKSRAGDFFLSAFTDLFKPKRAEWRINLQNLPNCDVVSLASRQAEEARHKSPVVKLLLALRPQIRIPKYVANFTPEVN